MNVSLAVVSTGNSVISMQIRVCFLFSHKKLLVFYFTVALWKPFMECKRQIKCFHLRAMNSIKEGCTV